MVVIRCRDYEDDVNSYYAFDNIKYNYFDKEDNSEDDYDQ